MQVNKQYIDQAITLRDGRRLAYHDVGPRDGSPIFYFHGWPSSRQEWRIVVIQELLEQLGVRLILANRPGVGGSAFLPARRILDWPSDVLALADALFIERFAVVGVSGGGPYALACALSIPERLTVVAVVNSLAPFEAPEIAQGITRGEISEDNFGFFHLMRDRPRAGRRALWKTGVAARVVPRVQISRAIAAMSPVDRKIMHRPENRSAILANVKEATRQPRGTQLDGALLVLPWGFAPEDIGMPVRLWHGEADDYILPAMGRYLAGAIPRCEATFVPGEGHVSLICNHIEPILTAVIA